MANPVVCAGTTHLCLWTREAIDHPTVDVHGGVLVRPYKNNPVQELLLAEPGWKERIWKSLNALSPRLLFTFVIVDFQLFNSC